MNEKCHQFLLRLIILFLLRGASGVLTDVFCSYGENVTLPCNNAHADCTWIYERNRDSIAVVLFANGIKKNNTERHDRLSLESDCSLNIYKVTKEDRGLYSCKQYKDGIKRLEDGPSFSLHVLHVSSPSTQTEIRPGSSVTLSCHLYSYDEYYCDPLVDIDGVQLVWVNHAGVNLQTYSRFQILHSGHCNSTLTTTFLNEDNNTEWRCLATFKNEVKTSASYTVEYLVAVWPTLDVSSSRVIIFLGEIAALTAPTVILLLIFCEKRPSEFWFII
ncbi:uncharacterized protein LOC127649021 [Xyrauchen texanus]|uniref:uncharacterized protein LOC127649021 n=1 Tax=Xyrauchen texanus TaxID=154827 RepID=UPI002241D2B4|nr:uncharacterized protein LOC127649021 [Xyrauchen texanus]